MAVIRNFIWIAIVTAGLLIALFAINIDAFFYRENINLGGQAGDIFYRIFGQLRYDIAAMLYLKADRYYHGGTSHAKGHEHTLQEEVYKHHQAHVHKETEDLHGEELNGRDLFWRIDHAIRDHRVIHLHGKEAEEVAPWFEIAALIDPNFIPAYVVGGFWVGQYLHKPDSALKFLKKGLMHNPGAWQIYEQAGDIYFTEKKDYSKASAYFKRAYLLMDIGSPTDLDKKRVLLFLAACLERTEDYKQSLYYYEKIHLLVPSDQTISNKIFKLKHKLGNIAG